MNLNIFCSNKFGCCTSDNIIYLSCCICAQVCPELKQERFAYV